VRRVRSALATVGVGALLLVAIELGLRLAGFSYDVQTIIGGGLDLHRFHPRWLWEPRPGAIAGKCGDLINADGFRGPPARGEKPAGVLRVVALGDSSTYGMGVCVDETWVALIAHERPWIEPLDLGVIGFSALQGAELLRGRGLAYRPDIVVAAFGAVNEAMPAMGPDVEARFARSAGVSPWAASLRDRLRNVRLMQLAEWCVRAPPELPAIAEADLTRSQLAPNESVESFTLALEDIVRTSRAARAPIVLVLPPRRRGMEAKRPQLLDYDAAIRDVALRERVPVADVQAAFRGDARGEDALLLDGVHPSRAGHAVYARVVARAVDIAWLMRAAP
jgi:GDSL-like lipase/acylhydrolase family protein